MKKKIIIVFFIVAEFVVLVEERVVERIEQDFLFFVEYFENFQAIYRFYIEFV